MNSYGPPPPQQQQGQPPMWPQQPQQAPMSGFNGNPSQANLVNAMGNVNLNDANGPPAQSTGHQKFMPPVGPPGSVPFGAPPGQHGLPPAGPGQPVGPPGTTLQQVSNGLQSAPPSATLLNNNGNPNNQFKMAPPSTTPVQNGQGPPPPSAASVHNQEPLVPGVSPFMPPLTQQQQQQSQYLPPGQGGKSQGQMPLPPRPLSAAGQQQQFGTNPQQQVGRPPSNPMSEQQQQPNQFSAPKMPPLPGGQFQQPPYLNQQPSQPGQFAGQPPIPGQNAQPPYPGQNAQPPYPGQKNQPTQQFPGKPPGQFAPGQQQFQQQPPSAYPGGPPTMGPPMPGQQSFVPGGQPPQPFPGQQPGMLPGQPPFPGHQPGMPPQPGQYPPGMPPQPGQYPPGMPPQSGQYPPGMPPQPYPGQAPGFNQPPQAPGQYPQGQSPPMRRLDPDQMPNPIQVMVENQNATTGPFVTNQPGLVPPLVTTKFVTHDQGNSSPRFIRSSMYNVPHTAEMMKQTAVPFTLMMSPFARPVDGEIVPPIVDFGEMGPIRCIRCKAYMCPNMQFIDAGRRFQCLLCKVTTEVPQEYFKHLDHTGQREDKYERPELVLGTYEFVATKDYCRNNIPPKSPAMIFVIDVSYNNIKSGLIHLLCAQMKNIIKNLPIDQGHNRSQMKVGFITYNNSVHFYNIKSNLAQPQMMVVGDVFEMFMPLLDGFLCDPEESSAVIDSLMEQIPTMFGDTRETETVLLPAIQAGMEALKASECAGKLFVFHSTLPVAEAPGKLRNRDDRNVLGTEKEKTVLTPQINLYNNLGQDCIQAGCAVDLFLFNNSYIDIATIGQVCRLTGGEVYKYTYFQADIDGERLINDLIKNISRPIAFDAVMRVRTSAGVRPTDFYGHFFMSNTTDMEIAAIDSDKSVVIEIKHDDKLSPDENVYIQTALLYTSVSGQRRLRILNLALKVCTQMTDLFRYCDLDVLVLYFAKKMIFSLMEQTPKVTKDALESRCAQILACYRKNCASPTSSGQLILPECMKLLPLYASCILKNDAISGGQDMTCDDRSYVMQFVLAMDLPMSVSYFYPRLIPIHDANPHETTIPDPIRCTIEKMIDNGAYILENGVHLFIWLGLSLSPEFTQSVFDVPSVHQIDTDRGIVPTLENPMSERIRGIINRIQAERPRCMRVTIIRQRDKLENVLKHYLIEDRGSHGAPSYVDYLCHLHKEIRALLS